MWDSRLATDVEDQLQATNVEKDKQFGFTRNNHELSHRALAEYQHLATDVDRDLHWTKCVEKDRNEHRI